MINWNERKRQSPLLHYFLIAYWLVLLVWQNFGGGENRSGLDLMIKFGLILMLVVYYFTHVTGVRRDILKIILVFAMIYGVIKMSDGIEMSSILYYFFPFLFILLTYGVGSHFDINRKQLVRICNILIIVMTYTVVYALIFCFDQFKNAFSIDNAYGNELTSFLYSNHEYGLYLAFAIMSSILCMEIDPKITQKRRILYYLAMVLFGINLILTFSRTAMLALLIMLICYTVAFAKRRLKSIMVWSAVFTTMAILLISPLRNFVWEIVMKENTDAGRESLIDTAVRIFKESSRLERIFGRDFYYVERFLRGGHGFSSFHNAFITQLICNGVVGVVFISYMSMVPLYDIYQTVKSDSEYNRVAKFFIGFSLSSLVFMMFNTSVLFASSIDSYFLTLFAVLIPKYVNRSICRGTFDIDVKEKGYGKTML